MADPNNTDLGPEAPRLTGKLPENFLGGVQASPHKVASNIRGFFANKFGAALPDTGKNSILLKYIINSIVLCNKQPEHFQKQCKKYI